MDAFQEQHGRFSPFFHRPPLNPCFGACLPLTGHVLAAGFPLPSSFTSLLLCLRQTAKQEEEASVHSSIHRGWSVGVRQSPLDLQPGREEIAKYQGTVPPSLLTYSHYIRERTSIPPALPTAFATVRRRRETKEGKRQRWTIASIHRNSVPWDPTSHVRATRTQAAKSTHSTGTARPAHAARPWSPCSPSIHRLPASRSIQEPPCLTKCLGNTIPPSSWSRPSILVPAAGTGLPEYLRPLYGPALVGDSSQARLACFCRY